MENSEENIPVDIGVEGLNNRLLFLVLQRGMTRYSWLVL